MREEMKRLVEFLVCFFLVTGVVYMKPVISSRNTPKEKDELTIKEIKTPPKAVPYYELNTSGMANLVGKSKSELLKEYPDPKKSFQTLSGSEWLVYGTSTEDYFQVEVTSDMVSSVFVLGTSSDTAPFTIDMNLADLAEITTIFSNFKFEYGNELYEVELTEDDMNYRPLVAFNNGTFAMLQMNQKTGQLIAVRYLDKKTLLEIMPYQLEGSNPFNPVEHPDVDWSKINQENRNQLFLLLNLLRGRDKKKPYVQDIHLQLASEKALQTLKNKPELIIEDKERAFYWHDLNEGNSAANTDFKLSTKETQKLLKLVDVTDKKVHSLLYAPIIDVPFMVTNWYGNRLYHEELMHKKDGNIAIAFDENAVFLFLTNDVEKPTTTESSE